MSSADIITPICCILGHVDVGKTKLLDYLRHTTTEEVSGITQQIGTTYFTKPTLEKLCGKLGKTLAITGMIMIDTPGHNCFTTMRQVGALISNLVIVVVDIVKGLEHETINCLKFVRDNHGANFVIALNKLDKIYGWNSTRGGILREGLKKNKHIEIKNNINKIVCQLAELEINACAYYENKDIKTYVSMIPISASTGEGVADLIALISKMMEFETKKVIDSPIAKYSFGYLIDQRYEDKLGNFNISVNTKGTLTNNDKILVIDRDTKTITETKIKNIIMSDEAKEMKEKNRYKPVESITGTQGIGIFFNDQIKPSPGSIYAVVTSLTDEDKISLINLLKSMVKDTGNTVMCHYEKYDVGLYISSPSTNMISGLIKSANEKHIPIYDHHIGKITKDIIIKASGVYSRLGKEQYKTEYLKKYAVILLFDPVIGHGDSQELVNAVGDQTLKLCEENGITIIAEKTVYGLLEKYEAYCKKLDDEFYKKYYNIGKQIKLQILPQYIFLKSTPLMFGVRIVEGSLKLGMTIIATKGDIELNIGKIIGIQKNNKSVDGGNINDELCIKFDNPEKYTYGDDFDATYVLKRFMSDLDIAITKFIDSV